MLLFATDLDGTLLDRDGKVRPRDRRAIEEARKNGVVVTIATGRLTSGTHAIATDLGLDAPMVCGDGSITACAATKRILHRRPIRIARVDEVLEAMSARKLARFVFTPGAIHSCELGTRHHHYVSSWSPDITTHAEVARAEAWRIDRDGVMMLLAIGDPDAIDDLALDMEKRGADLETLAFTLEHMRVRAARFIVRGTSKGNALAAIAADLGIDRDSVAVAGDWYNDLSMFAWAGRSFAMPHAPADVKAEATDVLSLDGDGGEGVADALERWLHDERNGVPDLANRVHSNIGAKR